MAGSSTTWSDFDRFVKDTITRQTVLTLRQFAERIQTHSGISLNLKSQERKSDIISKIQGAFELLRRRNDTHTYLVVRQACENIIGPNRFEHRYGHQLPPPPPPTFGGVPNISRNGGYTAAGPSRTSSWQTHSTTTAYSRASPTLQDWKANPMWKPIKALTNMDMLPDIASNEDSRLRRERKTHFSLPTDVIEKLNYSKSNPTSHPHYSVRLFCASSDYFRPPNLPVTPQNQHIVNRNIPIEYPANPDTSVDDFPISFKERGLRGKAGSAPPLDLDKSHKGLVRIAGRMASLVVGHTGPTVGKKKDQSKKFWYQVVFTEMTTTEELLERLTALAPTDVDETIAAMRRKAEEDDDIEFGISTLSLRDPLAGMRITTPIRSSKCTHSQCFDARWWLESNRTHPQFLCPHCNRELKFDDLICDGYFLSILRAVPEEVDEVVLEPDGEWHTEDNKYASAIWAAAHPSTNVTEPVTNGNSPPPTAKRERSESVNPEPDAQRSAIEILSDDSEDEQPLRRTLTQTSHHPPRLSTAFSAPSAPSTTPAPAPRPADPQSDGVIDLTLSSDEDDDEPPPTPRASVVPSRRSRGAADLGINSLISNGNTSISANENGHKKSRRVEKDELASLFDDDNENENGDLLEEGEVDTSTDENERPYFRLPGVDESNQSAPGGDWIQTRTTNEVNVRDDRLSGASTSEASENLSFQPSTSKTTIPNSNLISTSTPTSSVSTMGGGSYFGQKGFEGPNFSTTAGFSALESGSGSDENPTSTTSGTLTSNSGSFDVPSHSDRNLSDPRRKTNNDRMSRESSASSNGASGGRGGSSTRIMLRIDRSRLNSNHTPSSTSPLSLGSLLNSNTTTPPINQYPPSLSPTPMTSDLRDPANTMALHSVSGGDNEALRPSLSAALGTSDQQGNRELPLPRNPPRFQVNLPRYDPPPPPPQLGSNLSLVAGQASGSGSGGVGGGEVYRQPSTAYRDSVWCDPDQLLDELTTDDEHE